MPGMVPAVFPVLPALFVLVAGGYGGYLLRSGIRRRTRIGYLDRNGQGAQGTVTRVSTRVSSFGNSNVNNRTYRPSVRFSLPDGRVVETETGLDMRNPMTVGESVDVVYLPDDPTQAEIDKGPEDMSTFAGLGGIAVGAALLLFALYQLIKLLTLL